MTVPYKMAHRVNHRKLTLQQPTGIIQTSCSHAHVCVCMGELLALGDLSTQVDSCSHLHHQITEEPLTPAINPPSLLTQSPFTPPLAAITVLLLSRMLRKGSGAQSRPGEQHPGNCDGNGWTPECFLLL